MLGGFYVVAKLLGRCLVVARWLLSRCLVVARSLVGRCKVPWYLAAVL